MRLEQTEPVLSCFAVMRPYVMFTTMFLLVLANSMADKSTTATAELHAKEPPGYGSMVRIPGGTFLMGTDSGTEEEGPVHKVTIRPFLLDTHEVTVKQFEAFVLASGHITAAERDGFSKAFDMETGEWQVVDGANWRRPEGPDMPPAQPEEPVTQVSYFDALAFAKWVGKRLPTEAEWEFAARGGLVQAEYSWGNELSPNAKMMANWWQGVFPERNELKDGFLRRAPILSFPRNGYGLADITGNVWEWVNDWHAPEYFKTGPKDNPTGPTSGTLKLVRGGSFLCSENFCAGFRVAARMMRLPDTGLNNLGFRCARDVSQDE